MTGVGINVRRTQNFKRNKYLFNYWLTKFHTLSSRCVAQTPSALAQTSSSHRYLFDLLYLYVYLLTVLRISLHWKLPSKLSTNRAPLSWPWRQQGRALGLQCILNGVFTVPYYITVLNIIMNLSGVSQITHFDLVFFFS